MASASSRKYFIALSCATLAVVALFLCFAAPQHALAQATGSISGTVTEAVGSTAVEAAVVTVYESTTGHFLTSVATDDTGAYTIGALETGSYKILFSPGAGQNYAAQWYNGQPDQAHADIIIVSAPTRTTGIDAVLAIGGGSLSGDITTDVPPRWPIKVEALNASNGSVVTFTLASSGHYSVPGLPSGSYKVKFGECSEFGIQYYDNKTTLAQADTVAVTNGADTPNIDASLKFGGSISGTVTRAGGSTPVSNCMVEAYNSSNGHFVEFALTNASGVYKLSGLAPDSYKLLFGRASTYVAEWYNNKTSQASADDVVVPSPTTVSGKNVSLQTGASVSGTIIDAGTTDPIPNCFVNIYPVSGDTVVASNQTDVNGYYLIQGLATGNYKIEFSRENDSYIVEWYNNKPDQAHADTVSVTAPNPSTNKNASLVKGGSIGGTVTYAGTATGIPNCPVDAYNASSGALVDSTVTDVTGVYKLQGLRTAGYDVEFGQGFYASPQWYNDKPDRAHANAVPVTAGVDVTGIDAGLMGGGAITGTVKIAGTSTPIAGCSVSAYDVSTGHAVGTTVTDANGFYWLQGLEAGGYRLRFGAPGDIYVLQWYNNKPDEGTADVVPVFYGNTVTGKNASMVRGGSISGTVTDSGTTNPIQDCSVAAYSSTTGYLVTSTLTDINGDYQLVGLGSGNYKVEFGAGGTYIPQWYNNKSDQKSANSISVSAPGDTGGRDAALDPGGSISGIVADSGTSIGIPNCFVEAYDAVTGYAVTSVLTDGTGAYTLHGLATSEYKVSFGEGSSYVRQWYNARPDQGSADAVVVNAPGDTPNVDAWLDPGGSISGNVTDHDSSDPIPGCSVKALADDGVVVATTTTDVAGNYTLNGLASGGYTVVFGQGGVYVPGTATGVLVTAPDNTPNIDIALTRGANVFGRITAADTGHPIGGVAVLLFDAVTDQPMSYTGATDSDGDYEITGVPDGQYHVFMYPSDRIHAWQFFESKNWTDGAAVLSVSGNSVSAIDQALPLGGSISGTIRDQTTHAPIAGCQVELRLTLYHGHAANTLIPAVETDANGNYRIADQPDNEPVTVEALCSDKYHQPTWWYHNKPDSDHADVIHIAAGTDISDTDFDVPAGGTIFGYVADTGGAPMGGCAVTAYLYNAANGKYDTHIDTTAASDGTFSFDAKSILACVTPGKYKIFFNPDASHVPEWYDDQPDIAHADAVTVTRLKDTDVEAVLARKGGITGQVRVNDSFNYPIENVGVTAFRLDGGTWKQENGSTTLPNGGDPTFAAWGFYGIENLTPGTYKIFFSPGRPLWSSQWYKGKSTRDAATEITINDDEYLKNINVNLDWAKHSSFAVTNAGASDYASLLSSCGYKFESLQFDANVCDLTNLPLLKQYSIVFINCDETFMDSYSKLIASLENGGVLAQGDTPLSQYVRGGGKVFISDCSGITLRPDLQMNLGSTSPPTYPFSFIAKGPYEQVKKQTVTASILDSKMRSYLGASSLSIVYDVPGAAAVTGLDSHATEYMSAGVGTTWAGTLSNAPICSVIPLGSGKVYYQNFHMDKQRSDIAKLMMDFFITGGAPKKPKIEGVYPTAAKVGAKVTISGSNLGVSKSSSSWVHFNGTAVTTFKSWNASQIVVTVPKGASTGQVLVHTPGGTSNGVKFTVVTPPKKAWYLAEGSSNYGFTTYVVIENPNSSSETVQVQYMTPSGIKSRPNIVLPPDSQTTINPADTLGATDFSTKVVSLSGKTIAVDRRMMWTGPGAASPEASSSIGVTSASKTWYLAEGSSKWGFECWLLAQNPGSTAASLNVTYMIEGGTPVNKTKTLAAGRRMSWNMQDDIGQKDASIEISSTAPVIAERSMYRNNRREGHESIGTTSPSTTFYLAEGTTSYGFTSYVLVQNPNSKPASVKMTYMTGNGPVVEPVMYLPPNSRKTVRVNDENGMQSKDFSTKVQGSVPIIAERAMYWGASTPLGEACHDSVGLTSPHTTFYLPDGETSAGYETWTCVQNPNASMCKIQIKYFLPSGGSGSVKTLTDTIGANSRKTYDMSQLVKNGKAAIYVTSLNPGLKIMVERSMYWNNRGVGTNTIGGYSD